MTQSRFYLKCNMGHQGAIESPFRKYTQDENGKFKHEYVTRHAFMAYIRHYGRHWVGEKDGNGKWRDYIVTGDYDLYMSRFED